jgi:hypothetical protein
LIGFSQGNAFLRSPDNSFVLLPNGRLQVDGYFFHSQNPTPNPTALLRRARLELAGWVGGWVYFSIAGDFAQAPPPSSAAPALPANLFTTDDFVALAPWQNLFILQVGQFDAPFTLENRTSDKYFDFMERSVTVRAFGIPDNKEMGAMLHGYDEGKNFYYSLGVFNGDSQNFKNIDHNFDWMGRAWIAPFPEGAFHAVEFGASYWTGYRSSTLAPTAQTTQGGFVFFPTASFQSIAPGTTAITTVQLRQQGPINAAGLELNVPVDHRYGVRGEVVWRHSSLKEANVSSPASPVFLVPADLRGWSAYGEAWLWLIGDDTIIGDQQGLEPFGRYTKFGVRPPQRGLMVAFRFEHLDEALSEPAGSPTLVGLPNPALGTTRLNVYELGINAWLSKRYRLTFNYLLNRFGGDTPYVQGLSSMTEQEFLFRFGIAL